LTRVAETWLSAVLASSSWLHTSEQTITAIDTFMKKVKDLVNFFIIFTKFLLKKLCKSLV